MSKISQILTKVRQNNLTGREILDDFTREELKAIYNGIGPDRFPDWLRAIVTEANGLFEPAALIHDVRFYIGGTREDFSVANAEFKKNCYTLVYAAYSWYNPRRYKWQFRAWRYYHYCEDFGWDGFHKTAEKCECTRCKQEKGNADNDAKGPGAKIEVDVEPAEAAKCAECEECTCNDELKVKKKNKKGKK